MERKRRNPTPLFRTPPPFNPISGKYENLSQDGVSPYCAMMQVAAEDVYANYVICRGFDPRILKFVDYEVSNPDKPGISVAKPFGSRGNRTYHIGEVYPAFLPTQGTPNYVPPSPVEVLWRLGQNPGAIDPTVNGGQPADLTEEILLLNDHNDKAINWMLIDSADGSRWRWIQFTLTSALISPGTATATVDYDSQDEGSVGATVTVTGLIAYGAVIGNKGVALKAGANYIVVELPQTGSSGIAGTVLVQGVLATRSGSAPENKFPAWAGDLTTAYVDSGSLVSLSSGYTLVPFSTCKNPHGLNGEEGDTFVAVLDPDDEDDKFILLEVYSKKSTIFFTFTADRECGGNFDKDAGTIAAYDQEIAVTVQSWRHPGKGPEGFEGTLKVQDTFLEAMLANAGDVGYAQWNTAKQVWSIIKAQHYATDLKGTTTSDGGGSDPDHYWYCTPSAGFDGYFDSSKTLTPVYVPIGWTYPDNGIEVWFKWNPKSCRYEAYQANYPCEG